MFIAYFLAPLFFCIALSPNRAMERLTRLPQEEE
jgi:hypothetical protein